LPFIADSAFLNQLYFNYTVSMSRFSHLHTHSHYSLLSALPKIDELVAEAKKLGMGALALTDNGNLYGAIEFYKAAKKAGVKPIIGVDFYVAARSRKDMQAGIDNRRSRLVLLAMNEVGYKNLMKLVTDSHLEGFYYKPRVDRELIEKYNDGLIAIIPSFSGEIAQALKGRSQDKAKEVAEFYKRIFGGRGGVSDMSHLESVKKVDTLGKSPGEDSGTAAKNGQPLNRLFIEITRHPEIDGHEAAMKTLTEFAHQQKIPVAAAHDTYYLHPEDRQARETLVRVNSFRLKEQRNCFATCRKRLKIRPR
jgi:DNA polymerase-3 subunit alpha